MKKISDNKILQAIMVIGLLGLGHLSAKWNHWDMFSGGSHLIYARFESAAGLEAGHPVKMLGLKIGRVQSLRMDQENQVALAELKIDKDVIIYEDAFASIKMQGLLGDHYISIDPGGSGSILQSGETILETESLVDIAQLVSRYAFSRVTNDDKMGPIAQRSDARKVEWMD